MLTIRLRKRKRKKPDIFFADDIIISILSRLPAKNVLKCRLVCKRWRDLTSTHNFKQLQLRHSIPMIMVSHPSTLTDDFYHFLLDKWWEPERKRLVYHKFLIESNRPDMFYPGKYGEYWGNFSHGGLIVFEQSARGNVVLLNPTSHENVRIKLSEGLWSSEIYGVFFHPLLREYCTLWRIYVGDDRRRNPGQGIYKMLNLGFKPCWKEISNPWSHRVKIRKPLLVGEHLYWRVKSEEENGYNALDDIMEFDTRSENFGLMRCPAPIDVNCVGSNIKLLDLDGVLSFLLITRRSNLMNVSIWKLKDRAQQVWVSVNHSIKIKDCSSFSMMSATALVGEKLVLLLGQRLYVCDLKLGTTRTFAKKYNRPIAIFAHVMTLASLRNCKSRISMDKEGEVVEESDMA